MNVEPKVSLITHFRTDHGPRERAWLWLEKKWHHDWPELEVVVGTDDTGSQIFNASIALNSAVARSTGDVLIVCDADVYMAPAVLRKAARRLADREVKFLSPWNRLIMFSEHDTNLILKTPPQANVYRMLTDEARKRVEPWDHHNAPGSLIMVSRQAYDVVGGNDERFIGWGGADKAFWCAVNTLWGAHKRDVGELLHLWHPRLRDHKGNWVWARQNKWYFEDLLKRYEAANLKPIEMRKILQEKRRDIYST